ncbi:GNAT family N-acetyltransferase [Gammaproteobacteria bacterium]|nr:GNAT family N-acetyltransferase [Gammaproteobacteria bacterium]
MVTKNPEIVVRQATLDDSTILSQFNMSMAEETEGRQLDQTTVNAGVKQLLRDSRQGFYLMAEVGGSARGSLMISYEWSDWRNGLFWWIQSVYVVPAARRSGVFTALYQYVKKMAQDDEAACGLRLYMEKDNLPARAVYMAMGMDTTPYQVFEDLF